MIKIMKKYIFKISFVAFFVFLMGLTESDAASNYLTVFSSPIFNVEIEFEMTQHRVNNVPKIKMAGFSLPTFLLIPLNAQYKKQM